jgi:hypothetical protein
MALAHQHNPIGAMREFVERVSQFDPHPQVGTAVTVDFRLGAQSATFELTEYTGRALCEALHRYYDPADVGPCDRCGRRRLDQNLRCLDCGHVNGVFGQVLLEHAERLRIEEHELEGTTTRVRAPARE